MALAFGAFAFGKRWYPREDVRAARPPKTLERREAERRTLLRITGVFAAIAVFWLIYDQNADTWIYFAQSHADLHLFGSVGLTSNQMQALNPVFIVLLTPVFNYLWNRAKRLRGGREVADTRKMLIGFGIVVVTSARHCQVDARSPNSDTLCRVRGGTPPQFLGALQTPFSST